MLNSISGFVENIKNAPREVKIDLRLRVMITLTIILSWSLYFLFDYALNFSIPVSAGIATMVWVIGALASILDADRRRKASKDNEKLGPR